MSGAGHEDDFEAYLRERSVLPRRLSTAQRIEPPKDLDALVLGKARQAIHAGPELRLYRAPRWALPVALAATILLSFSIVLNIGLTTRPRDQQASSASTALAPATAPDPAVAPPASQALASRAPQSKATATAPLQTPSEAGPAMKSGAAATARMAPGPSVSAPAGAASALAATPSAGSDSRSAVASADRAEQADSPARSAPLPELQSRAATGTPAKQVRDPAAWLRHIETLRARGETAEADAELRRFRAAFPDYPLSAPAPAAHDPPKEHRVQ
ncbi:MAG TPA: hypothetical protein VGL55_15405 [Steroidobacteraceae bacterium]|jgi:hypothetical protein